MILQLPESGCGCLGVIMDWGCFQPEPDVGLGCVYFLSYCLGNDENNKECGEKQTSEASRSFMKQANFVYFFVHFSVALS